MQPKSALAICQYQPFLMYIGIVVFSKLEPIKNHLQVVFLVQYDKRCTEQYKNN